MTLTGKTRYRCKQRLFRKPLLILQVQFTCRYGYHGDLRYEWRDATLEDYCRIVE